MPAANSPAAGTLREPAPAKVNLFLRVTGRRADGYHELDSLVVFAGAQDTVYAQVSDTLALEVTGRFAAGLGAGADNLVLRAAHALAAQAGRAALARLILDKNLPVASGIGGGSSDAAATLRVLARLWGVGSVPPALALRLGADVPVCLNPSPSLMRGVGEQLSAAPVMPEYGLALVNPGVGVSTADVFRARAGAFSRPLDLPKRWQSAAAMANDLAAAGNDLQAAAMELCPPIGDVLGSLRTLPGCLLAQMSGSGATCFGIFTTAAQAEAALRLNARPGWWAWGGAPLPSPARGLPEPAACP